MTATTSRQPSHLSTGWLSDGDCHIEDFVALTGQQTQLADYRFASRVDRNALVYDCDELRAITGDPGLRRQVMAEFAEALLNGPGIIVLAGAFPDASVVDGVTAAFNLNMLARLNRELGADFDLDGFEHRAGFNPALSRIEMHLASRRRQAVRIAGRTVAFDPGETIHTENSYKYGIEGFRATAARAGWRPAAAWTDAAGLFSVHALSG